MITRESVLIVEDEDEWCGIYKRAIHARHPGHTIKIANNLATAERFINETTFAVAFVDIGLDLDDIGNVDGLRVMEKIRAANEDTSIVVVTGMSKRDMPSAVRQALKRYGVPEPVGKATVVSSDISRLFEEGLDAYLKSVG